MFNPNRMSGTFELSFCVLEVDERLDFASDWFPAKSILPSKANQAQPLACHQQSVQIRLRCPVSSMSRLPWGSTDHIRPIYARIKAGPRHLLPCFMLVIYHPSQLFLSINYQIIPTPSQVGRSRERTLWTGRSTRSKSLNTIRTVFNQGLLGCIPLSIPVSSVSTGPSYLHYIEPLPGSQRIPIPL